MKNMKKGLFLSVALLSGILSLGGIAHAASGDDNSSHHESEKNDSDRHRERHEHRDRDNHEEERHEDDNNR